MPFSMHHTKTQRRFNKAIVAIDRHGASRREGARIARLPLSTFQYRLTHKDDIPKRRGYLKHEEERVIVDLIKHYSARGFPLKREDLADAVQILVASLPEERRQMLPFVNGRPGKKFMKNFVERHQEEICFKRSSKEEDIRWRSCNAETLTTHMAAIQKLISDNCIYESRIVNIDESGISPNRDCLQSKKKKGYRTRSTKPQQRAPKFTNIDHVTLMPAIFANGRCGRPLFVLKGKQLKYRVTVQDGEEKMETVSSCLPKGALTFLREQVAGVDSNIFFEWAKRFAVDCEYLVQNGRKVLLLLDGYRSHMSYRTMHMLSMNGIIVYALPSHTSGITQPLDVGVFSPFKEHLRNSIEGLSSPDQYVEYTAFDLLKLVSFAYRKAFTRSNIYSAFGKSGINPMNWKT